MKKKKKRTEAEEEGRREREGESMQAKLSMRNTGTVFFLVV